MSIVDDTDPRFIYKDDLWSTVLSISDFNGSSHVTSTPSAILSFGPFVGTSISVFGTIGPNQPTVHYVIDGSDSADTRNQSSDTPQPQQLLYLANDLAATEQHNLNINVLDSGTFSLDFVSIMDTSEMQIVSPAQSSAVIPPTISPTLIPSPTSVESKSLQGSSIQLSTFGAMSINIIHSSSTQRTTYTNSEMHISNTSTPQSPQFTPPVNNSLVIGLATSIFIVIGAVAFGMIYYHFRQKISSQTSGNIKQYWRHRFRRRSYRVTPFISQSLGNASMVLPRHAESINNNVWDTNQRPVSGMTIISHVALRSSSTLDGDSKTRPTSDSPISKTESLYIDRSRGQVTITNSIHLPMEDDLVEIQRTSSISSSSSLPPSYETFQE